jgi:hypothetical protein
MDHDKQPKQPKQLKQLKQTPGPGPGPGPRPRHTSTGSNPNIELRPEKTGNPHETRLNVIRIYHDQ